MRRFSVHAAWAMALSLGLGCLAGCGGSGSSTTTVTGPAPSITSFSASPAAITAGASASLTGVFSGGTGVITPGNVPATSGTAVSVNPTATTTYTLTVTATNGTVVTKTATVTVNVPNYKLTVDSTDPASGVEISYIDSVTNSSTTGTTSFTATYSSGTNITLTAPAVVGNQAFSNWTGCTSATTVTCTVTAIGADTTVTANYAAPSTPIYVLTVDSANPASGVAVSASPKDLNSTATGTTSFTLSYASGTAVTLTAPATSGSSALSSWTGCASATTVTCNVTMSADTAVTANYTIAPTVTVTPSLSAIGTTQPLAVAVTVSGGSGNPVPTGTVTLTSGSYTSAATALSGGSAKIVVPGGSLAVGSSTLKATYTPDSASSSIYNSGASGTSSAVAVSVASQVTVTTPSTTLKATDKILGMNLAYWSDVAGSTNAPIIKTAFQTAGIKSVRWPGGSGSDEYNWETNTECGGYAVPADDFTDFVNNLVTPTGLDLALTADYGMGKNCTGPGDPTEAAAWVAEAKTLNANLTHVTVGNEEYGASWEFDNHIPAHDPTTYAAAVAGTGGYYNLIKAANSNVLVGVDVEPNYAPWDQDVMSGAPYDFVEYHYYPETPGAESDTTLMQKDAQQLTANINTIKAELAKWGTTVPIYVGEIGGPYSNPGKQSWSITQGLYAGEVLGEVMNDGVSRLTWWIGFGNCNGTAGWNSASLYGWQDFGAYNVFSDGASDISCPDAGPMGTMSPTARAFQLFSNVAVSGEDVLTAGVTGDSTDVRAYAATHDSGAATAVAVFNLNETTSEPVVITVPAPTTASKVTVITYDKSIYDLTGSPTGVFPDPVGTSTWADPTTTTINSPTLPLTLTLTPWSMNVVIVE
jgi:hypothetical protein